MPELSTLHHELRSRVPNKPYEFYNDALRWAINEISIKTSLWVVETNILTTDTKDTYNLDMPQTAAIHSLLYCIQRGAADRVIKRPVNGFKVLNYADADYLKAFAPVGHDQVQIFPHPKTGGSTISIFAAVKPLSGATFIDNDKFFEEYKDVVVDGALYRCERLNKDIKTAQYFKTEFRNGIDSIHVDVLKSNSDTSFKANTSW